MKNKQTATHWVLAHGVDCDGQNSGYILSFNNEEDANNHAYNLSSWSDGLQYMVTNSWPDVEEYCHYYGKKSLPYKTIDDEIEI
jgi:hypothetical protein